jgi:hypothetical protein
VCASSAPAGAPGSSPSSRADRATRTSSHVMHRWSSGDPEKFPRVRHARGSRLRVAPRHAYPGLP